MHLKRGYENIIVNLWLYTECHFYAFIFIYIAVCVYILYVAFVLLLFYSGDVELNAGYIKGLTKTVTYTYMHILAGFGLSSVYCTYVYIFVTIIITCCC